MMITDDDGGDMMANITKYVEFLDDINFRKHNKMFSLGCFPECVKQLQARAERQNGLCLLF